MSIVLDAMGSDQYPEPEILGAINFVSMYREEVYLVGNQDVVESKLKNLNKDNLPIHFIHAPDVLEMGEKAVESARKKPDNSMAIGMQLVKEGKAQAFVTAGNTGAAMFSALRKLGRLKGVLRPGLTAQFPVKGGHCVVVDIGANADCRPEFLFQFAIMGSQYAEKVLKIEKPRVGLLSNGEEPGKGNDLIKHTFPLLEKSGLNFIGNIEGKELFGGQADVAVTDGFTGNVLLKTSEAVAKLIVDVLREELLSSFRTKIGGLLSKPAFGKIKKMLDPGETGAAPLLGIDGLVFVGHGRSDAFAVTNALIKAHQAIQSDLMGSLGRAIQERLIDSEQIEQTSL
jgi:phosphate acyltransferase